MARKCSECGDSMGGFFGTPESRAIPNVCVQCVNKRSAEQKMRSQESLTQNAHKATNSDEFRSSGNAIKFLDVVNNVVFFIACLSVLYTLFLAVYLSKVLIAVSGIIAAVAALIGWCITRVLIGVAKDLRVSRDNTDKLLTLINDKLDSSKQP